VLSPATLSVWLSLDLNLDLDPTNTYKLFVLLSASPLPELFTTKKEKDQALKMQQPQAGLVSIKGEPPQ